MTANTVIVPQATRDGLHSMMKSLGVARAAQILGVARQTLERAEGGLKVQRGTASMLTQLMEARETKGS